MTQSTGYIKLKDSGISLLAVTFDGISLALEKEGKQSVPYIHIADAVGWYERELKITQDKKTRKIYENNLSHLLPLKEEWERLSEAGL